MLCNRNISSAASDTGVPGLKLPLRDRIFSLIIFAKNARDAT